MASQDSASSSLPQLSYKLETPNSGSFLTNIFFYLDNMDVTKSCVLIKHLTTFCGASFPSDPSFCCLVVKAAFLLGLLDPSGGVLIVASQRQRGPSAAHPGPWVHMKGD